MFAGVAPAVLSMVMVVFAAFTFDISVWWKLMWWLSGTGSAWLITNFKGENFNGGVGRIMCLGIIGLLGFLLVPLALVALATDWRFCLNIEEKWSKEARERDEKNA